MIVLAALGTFGALCWSVIVMMANGMRSSRGDFIGGGTMIAAWFVAAALWLAWAVG